VSISVTTIPMSADLTIMVPMDPCENIGHADEVPVVVGTANEQDEEDEEDDLDEDEDQDDEGDEELDGDDADYDWKEVSDDDEEDEEEDDDEEDE
jgi:hypothetical protein